MNFNLKLYGELYSAANDPDRIWSPDRKWSPNWTANDLPIGNDPQIEPQMISRSEMIPKLNRKWSRTANDPAGIWGMAWSLVSWNFSIFYFNFDISFFFIN